MNNERKATLDASAVLLSLVSASDYVDGGWLTEEKVEQKVQEAQAKLDAYRRGRAGWLALNALLPGWKEVDASDYLKQEDWHAFVSNDPAEWVVWLTSKGVAAETASDLVTRAFQND